MICSIGHVGASMEKGACALAGPGSAQQREVTGHTH